jgi:pantoate--beta-alanine ligase
VLSRAIRQVERLASEGERRSDALIGAARGVLAKESMVRVDYVELVDWETLLPVSLAAAGTLVAVAAWVGNTRLIDNAILE